MDGSVPELTVEQKRLLQDLQISENSPGPIVHDFQLLLDFVREASPSLTSTGLLPLKSLDPLNEQMSRRIAHGLSRPQQKSFPHINGLFLLLRVSGLSRVETQGRQTRLELNESMVANWDRLTPPERYFHLLESWLLRGDPDIVGERGRMFYGNHPLYYWWEFFSTLRTGNSWTADWAERVRYRPGLLNLALMELFGLVTIQDGPVLSGQGWEIAEVQPTDWGWALGTLLAGKLLLDWEFMETIGNATAVTGYLQPILRPYRPDWRQVLEAPANPFRDGLHIFRIALDKDLWRRIAIPGSSPLHKLANAILDAYRFDYDHLYEFIYPTLWGVLGHANHPRMSEGPWANEVRIGDLPLAPGLSMQFHYDFGDDWRFQVLLERIDAPDSARREARVIERKGRSPEQYPRWE